MGRRRRLRPPSAVVMPWKRRRLAGTPKRGATSHMWRRHPHEGRYGREQIQCYAAVEMDLPMPLEKAPTHVVQSVLMIISVLTVCCFDRVMLTSPSLHRHHRGEQQRERKQEHPNSAGQGPAPRVTVAVDRRHQTTSRSKLQLFNCSQLLARGTVRT